MEDVLDALRERNETIPVPLDLPDHDMLVEVEEALFLPLPREYREFLLSVSDVVCGSIEPATAADPQMHTYLPEIAATAWSVGVSRELIPMCEVNGDYYCVAADDSVVFWSVCDGRGQTDDEWPTVWHWAREVWLQS